MQDYFLNKAHANGIIINGTIVFVTSLQIPFKFFVAKEFFMIMYDELLNYSISDKVIRV